MTAVTGRDNLILGLNSARSKVLEAIAGLTDEQMSRPGPEGWSIKDHLNHLTVWDELRFHEINRISRGGQAAFPAMAEPDVDALNDMTVALRRQLPVGQVMADMEFARALVLEAVASATEHGLNNAAYGEVSLGGSILHDLGHAEAIRELRQREGI